MSILKENMTKKTPYNYLILLVALLIFSISKLAMSSSSRIDTKCECEEQMISRHGFPHGFLFAAATSAYQVEGAYNENGKGMSLWDNFTHMYPEKIRDGANGDVAIDSYHRLKDDVLLAKDLGLDAYRFSISWSRILPGGTRSKGINQDGIDYYNQLINELLANGIEPFVTIFHFNVPQCLQDAYGGFLSPQIVADLEDFGEILFSEFGDRVKFWITINEPWTFSYHGYGDGKFAPGRCSDWHCTGGNSGTEPYIVTHHQLLAHAALVNLYKTKYQKWQKGKIGITLVTRWYELYDDSKESEAAKHRALDFMLGWFMDPITRGKYPKKMRAKVGGRLPKFSNAQKEMLRNSFDFIGLNYYTSAYAQNSPNDTSSSYLTDSEVNTLVEKDNETIGGVAVNGSVIYIYPKGLRDLLIHMKEKYNNPTIFITENGVDEARNDSLTAIEAVRDDIRKDFFRDHLCCVHQAIKEFDVDIQGYFAWSLLDNFEWASGYSIRFGLVHVDFKNSSLTRYLKHSALWYQSILTKKKHSVY